jgi:hypothetical protein
MVSHSALEFLANETRLSSSQIQVMSDLACRRWRELSPEDVISAGELARSIVCRCLDRWGATFEEQRTVRCWLSAQMMRVAGSMFRSEVREAIRMCLPAALQIAPENRGGVEDIWLRLQCIIGPYLANKLTECLRTFRRSILGGSRLIKNGESWTN